MYETTSPETASFKIHTIALEWRPEAQKILTEYDNYYKEHRLFSAFQPEAGLYQRKASLVDRILAIAESVPEKEWRKLPTDLAERYRDYKETTEE